MRGPIVVLSLALLSSGCATIFGSHKAEMDFTSDPGGAEVLIDGQSIGHTPLKVELSNHKPLLVTFRKAGYQDTMCRLDTKVGAGWVVLDVLGGLIPVVVDVATGNWAQLPDHDCHVQLVPADT